MQVTDAPQAEAPTILEPLAGSVVADATPVIGGVAKVGDEIRVQDAAGQTICATIAKPTGTPDGLQQADGQVEDDSALLAAEETSLDGVWSCPSDIAALPEGRNVVAASVVSGGDPAAATQYTAFVVDTVAPSAPEVTLPRGTGELATGVIDLEGKAERGASVNVSVDGQDVCVTKVDPDESWACQSVALPDGKYVVRTSVADAAGNVAQESRHIEVTNVVDDPLAALLAPLLSVPTTPSASEAPLSAVGPVSEIEPLASVDPHHPWAAVVLWGAGALAALLLVRRLAARATAPIEPVETVDS